MVYRSTTYYNHEKQQLDVVDKIAAFLIVNGYDFTIKRLKKPIRNNDISVSVTGMSIEQYRKYREFLTKVGS